MKVNLTGRVPCVCQGDEIAAAGQYGPRARARHHDQAARMDYIAKDGKKCVGLQRDELTDALPHRVTAA
eukprot:2928751-Pleurochrysis_carterae.AAC.2